ncbi:MAG TPA: hypothetical protein VFR34_16455 [Paracoccaceae bacterium]|nr:hypothetical protein [Paracoccaceae bacterium]
MTPCRTIIECRALPRPGICRRRILLGRPQEEKAINRKTFVHAFAIGAALAASARAAVSQETLDSLSTADRLETRFGTLEFDLTNSPMVIEQPPLGLGTIDDMWFNWAIDVGFPGPERGHLPGGYGTGIATALEGSVRLAGNPPVPETRFVGGSGTSFNTIPPSDISFSR